MLDLEEVILIASIDTLNKGKMCTSSSKYELELALQLSKYIKVKIFSYKKDIGYVEILGNVQLLGVLQKNTFESNLNNILVNYKKNAAVIFWGYKFDKVNNYLKIQKQNKKLQFIPFIYDSHKPAIANLSLIKKIFWDFYFKLGMKKIKKFKAFLFFQKNAASRIGVENKPYLVTKPMSNSFELSRLEKNDKFNCIFAGTLNKLNSIDILLESLKYFSQDDNIEITCYGYGELKDETVKKEKMYDFFHYGGVVNESELKEIYARSDLALNLRKIEKETISFSFPSKLFEIIDYGVPVLTSKLFSDKELIENLWIIEDITPKNIEKTIKNIKECYYIAKQKACIAKQYINNVYNAEKQVKDIFEFLQKIYNVDI